MKNKIAVIFIAASILATTGCVSTPLDYKTGTQISQQQLQNFVAGETTQQEVITVIGQPNRKEEVKGKEVWYYDFNKVGVLSANVSEATVFEWDAKGNLLTSYKAGKSGNALFNAANK